MGRVAAARDCILFTRAMAARARGGGDGRPAKRMGGLVDRGALALWISLRAAGGLVLVLFSNSGMGHACLPAIVAATQFIAMVWVFGECDSAHLHKLFRLGVFGMPGVGFLVEKTRGPARRGGGMHDGSCGCLRTIVAIISF